MLLIRDLMNSATCRRFKPDARVRWRKGSSIDAYKPDDRPVACLYDGKSIPRGEWLNVYPEDNKCLTFIRAPKGGFNDAIDSIGDIFSDPVTAISFIGQFPISPFGYYDFGKGKFTAGPLGAWYLGNAKTAMGFLNGAFAPKIGGLPALATGGFGAGSGSGSGAGSGTYAADSPQNTVQNNSTIPVVYGRQLVAGQVVAAWQFASDSLLCTQMIVAVCDGEITQFGSGEVTYDEDQDGLEGEDIPNGLFINDKEARDYTDIFVSLRMGVIGQDAMEEPPSFGQEYNHPVTSYPVGWRFLKGETYRYTTRDAVNELHFNIFFPQGLFEAPSVQGESNKDFSITIEIKIYRVEDDSEAYNKEIKVSGNNNRPTYRTLVVKNLKDVDGGNRPSKFYCRVRRTEIARKENSDNENQEQNNGRRIYDCVIATINEKNYTPINYSGLALIGICMKASEQIGTQTPKVTCILKGRKIWNGSHRGYTQNPAWIVRDLLLSKRYGLGNFIAESQLISDEFTTFANFCDALVPKTSDSNGLVHSASNTNPIVVTTVKNHGLETDDYVTLAEILGNTAANGTHLIEVTGRRTFTVDVAGNGAYAGGGTWVAKEAAFRWDGVIDAAASALEVIQTIASTARGRINKYGNRIGVKIAQDSIPVFEFNEGNTRQGTFNLSYFSRENLPSIVEYNYQDRALRWSGNTVINDQFAYLTSQKSSVTEVGVTRGSQAHRNAAYMARRAQMPGFSAKWSAGLETMAIELGDVVRVVLDMVLWGSSGRIADQGVSSITLDKSITFEAGKEYIYTERDEDGQEFTERFTMSAGASSTLPFAPLAPGDATGRVWSIRAYGRREKLIEITGLSGFQGSERELEGIEHVGEVYTFDSGPSEDGVFAPDDGDPPDDATNLVFAEEYLFNGTSRITLSWDAGNNAVRYDVYVRFSSLDEDFAFFGSTGSTQLVFTIRAPWGITIEAVVVSVSILGDRKAPEDVAATNNPKTHVINRDDENEIVAEYPDPASNLALVLVAGNTYNLTWTHGANATGYVVVKNQWQGGFRVGETAQDFFNNIELNGFFEKLAVRAWREKLGVNGIVRYYSEAYPFILTETVVPTGGASISDASNTSPIVIEDTGHGLTSGMSVFVMGVLGNTAANGLFNITVTDADHFELDGSTGNGAYTSGGTWRANYIDYPGPTEDNSWRDGAIRNGNIVEDSEGFFGESLIQIDGSQDIQFLTPVRDAGATRSHFLSIDARVTSWILDPITNYYFSAQHASPAGLNHKEYVEWEIVVEHNTTGTFTDPTSYTSVDVSPLLDTDIQITARYYRLRVTGRLKAGSPGNENTKRVKIQVVRFLATA